MLDLEQIASCYPENLRPHKKNILREYLQHKILEVIFLSPAAGKLTFMGGTCIHLVHGSPRFSEDLDFDNPGISEKEFHKLARDVTRELELQGFRVELTTSFKGAFRARLRFPGLLHDYGLSGHRDEKLLVQIDTEPQRFAYSPASFILNRFDVFCRLNIVPADILAAQKIHCIFNRKRRMGRDFFDLVYLLGRTGVNFDYLERKMSINSPAQLREELLSLCARLDFHRLAADVEPFVYAGKDVERVLLFPEVIRNSFPG